jgi:hypothetical protein
VDDRFFIDIVINEVLHRRTRVLFEVSDVGAFTLGNFKWYMGVFFGGGLAHVEMSVGTLYQVRKRL